MLPYDRPQLKARAKAAMRAHSPNIYLVSLLMLVLGNASTMVLQGPTIRLMLQASGPEEALELYRQSAMMQTGVALNLAILVLDLFLTIVSIGYQLYCLRASRGEEPGGVATLFACFQQFWRFFAAYLLQGLLVFLWSLLLVVPGIIAAYAYSQTFYIMLDDPNVSAMEAIRRSKELMKGHKGELFVLELSFFGWALLTPFTFGLLAIWLSPYQHVTYANYYNWLSGWQPQTGGAEEENSPPEEWWNR